MPPFLISASLTSTLRISTTPPSHLHNHDLPVNPLSRESTLDLAQVIMLMTHALCESPKILTPRMKEPDIFDGSEPQKLDSFILLCNLYFRHNSAFSRDEEKITFALSHLQGTALELFEPTILDPSINPHWSHDWSEFVQTLQTYFALVDPTTDAEN